MNRQHRRRAQAKHGQRPPQDLVVVPDACPACHGSAVVHQSGHVSVFHQDDDCPCAEGSEAFDEHFRAQLHRALGGLCPECFFGKPHEP